MKSLGYLLIVVFSAAAGALVAHVVAKPPGLGGPTVSYSDVEKLSPQEVAERVLPSLAQRLADKVVAAGFGGSIDHGGNPQDAVIDTVDLRLRAKGAGWLGVCVADYLGIDLEPVRTGLGPPRVEANGSIRVRQSYRIVGDTTHDREWNDRYAAELDEMCGALGPDAVFFSIDSATDLRSVTDALPALRSASATASIMCTGNAEACRSPRSVLETLKPDRLLSVSSTDECDQRQTCLELTFGTGPATSRSVWSVQAKGTYQGTYSTGWGKLVLSEIKLEYR